MLRFILRTVVAATLSFAVKQYLESEAESPQRDRVSR